MTKVHGALLVGSHLLLGVLGWSLMGDRDKGGAGGSEEIVERDADPVTVAVEQEDNPIFRATGADFRAAWREMSEKPKGSSGELRWFSESFFIDWCGVDPEGAVLALRELYPPRRLEDLLSKGVQFHGAEMAAPLVEHWADLRFADSGDLRLRLTLSLNDLAKEDPAQAAQLLTSLSPEMRTGIHRAFLFRGIPIDQLEDFAGHLERHMLPEAGEKERENYWKNLAEAVDRTEPSGGVFDWLSRISSREGIEGFTGEGIRHAARFERWPQLLETIAKLDGESRQWAEATVVGRAGEFYKYKGSLVPFLEACRHGDEWGLAKKAYEASREGSPSFTGRRPSPRLADAPAVYLEWARDLPEEALEPRRIGLGYALLASPEEALQWAKDSDAGRSRDLIAADAIAELASDPDQGGAARDWLSLIRDPALKAAAEARLGGE